MQVNDKREREAQDYGHAGEPAHAREAEPAVSRMPPPYAQPPAGFVPRSIPARPADRGVGPSQPDATHFGPAFPDRVRPARSMVREPVPDPPVDASADLDARPDRSIETPPPPGLIPLLPHRIPAPPDVPEVPDDEDFYYEDDYVESEAAAQPDVNNPELSRIASRLRHDEVPSGPPADLDVAAVLEAVRHVPGVANAQLRGNPGGMHTLRLDLAEGADPGRVSRQVARLLKERMGLAAEPRRSQSPPDPLPAAGAPATHPPFLTDRRPGVPAPRGPEAGRETDLTAQTMTPAALESLARPTTLADVAGAERRIAEPPARVLVDQVRVSTLGSEATVEVRLMTGGVPSIGAATGPAVDGYLLRLAAQAAASAIDGLIEASPGAPAVRCFIDHAGVVPFGSCVVAVVVVLVTGAGWVEQLAGSAIVNGDPRQAIVRATLGAMNRRLESLLA